MINVQQNTLYSIEKSVPQLFSEQVRLFPDHIAIEYKEQRLTYRALDVHSNQLAFYLKQKGITRGQLVSVCLNRSIDLIISLLGILKAGAAYLPIDPAYPFERIRYMLSNSRAGWVITNSKHNSLFASFKREIQVFNWDKISVKVNGLQSRTVTNNSMPWDLAYVMYTSGTTGWPKGVMIEHGNIIDLVRGQDYADLKAGTILLSTGSPSFDATTFEYWGPLLNGGKLILCDEGDILDTGKLKQLVRDRSVNLMWFTSGFFNQIVDCDMEVFMTLRSIIVGGDKLSVSHIKKLQDHYPAIQIINGYGPTENCTFSLTYKVCLSQSMSSIPIGTPLRNRTAYVLDADQNICSNGVIGELYLGGAGIARGYLNDPELTVQCFLWIDIGNNVKKRLYRTGDLVCQQCDGAFEFIGRVDNQVKIRGYRVEPTEIEAVLLQSDMVDQAIILVKVYKDEEKKLVAYVKKNSPKALNLEDLLNYVKSRLPQYMVPSSIQEVQTWPLTLNGKIDKEALLCMDIDKSPAPNKSTTPPNEIEAKLMEIWKQLLSVETINVHDSFFELGGHSLLLVKLNTDINKVFQKQLSPSIFFEDLTIEKLALYLKKEFKLKKQTNQLSTDFDEREVTIAQKYFYLRNKLKPAESFPNSSIVYELTGEVDLKRLEEAFQEVIRQNESLRTSYHYEKGKVIKQIHKEGYFRVTHVFSPNIDIDEVVKEHTLPFNLRQPPLLRVFCIILPNARKYLYIDMPHINSDGISLKIIIEDVVAIYNDEYRYEGKASYASFQEHVYYYTHSEQYKIERDYWLKQLSEPIIEIKFKAPPTDFKKTGSCEGMSVVFPIPRKFTRILNEKLKKKGMTKFQFMLSAYVLLLYTITGSKQLHVMVPVHCRNQRGFERIIGLLANTLLLNFIVDEQASMLDFMRQSKNVIMQAMMHQEYPYEKLHEEYRSLNKGKLMSLYQTFFNYHSVVAVYHLREGLCKLYTHIRYKEVLPLSIDVYDTEQDIVFRMSSTSGIYSREELKTLACEYMSVVSMLLEKENSLITTALQHSSSIIQEI